MSSRIVKRIKTTEATDTSPPVRRKRGGRIIGHGKPVLTACADTLGAMLSAHDRRAEKNRLGGMWIHISSIINGDCLRAHQLAEREDHVSHAKPRPSDRVLWRIGKALEAHLRESLITLYGSKSFVGRWECKCGATEHSGLGDDSLLCQVCGSPVTSIYDEYVLQDERTRLSGSPDLLLYSNRIVTPLEAKSIKVVPKNGVRTSAPDFHSIEGPQRLHTMQVLMYHWLLTELGFQVSNTAIVVYIAKDYVMESPYKFFEVDPYAEENVMAVNNIVAMAEAYADAVDSDTLLPRIPQCPSCTTTRAKACPLVAKCFSTRK